MSLNALGKTLKPPRLPRRADRSLRLALMLVWGLMLAGSIGWPLAGWAETSPPADEAPPIRASAFNVPPADVAELREIQQRVESVLAKALPATVGIRIEDSAGSGVIVSADGYVLTAGHVSQRPGQQVEIYLSDGRLLKGTTLGINLDLDSALIKITDEGSFSFVEMAEANDIEEGQWVVATGHPGGVMKNRSAPARLGRVLFTNSKVVCTDCALVGGDSGGPLLDLDGRVVGVHSRIGWQVTTNFHVPVGTYHDTWDQLASSAVLGEEPSWEDDTRPVLGITGDPLAENCRIAQIFPGLPAADAGLHVGDVVVEVDGHDVARFDDLINHVLRKRPGDTIALHVLRGEQRIEVEVTLSNQRRPLPGSAERSDESPEDQADEEQPEEEPDDSQDTTPEEDAEDGSEQEDAEGD